MDINLTQKLRNKMSGKARIRGRYNSSELYFINHGAGGPFEVTPESWLHPKDKKMKDILNMWGGIGMHNQLEDLLGKEHSEEKKEIVYKGLTLVAKVDYLPPDKPDEVWEFKTSGKSMTTSKPWHDHQVKLYCSMFEKEHGLVYQPLQDDQGIYLKHLGTVDRDDVWFESELEQLYVFHQKVDRLWKGM